MPSYGRICKAIYSADTSDEGLRPMSVGDGDRADAAVCPRQGSGV